MKKKKGKEKNKTILIRINRKMFEILANWIDI